MDNLNSLFLGVEQALSQVIVGQQVPIRNLLVALLGGGHVILEGVPGTGKTLMVKALAGLVQAEFHRVQMTPDILPADILGVNLFDMPTGSFRLKKGPVFTNILLTDEINRTPPKTQAALLEAMEEQQVTFDGESLPLPSPFWVVATQNPLEFEGTYPLPEAQLDRFLFKLVVDYPDPEAERQMLANLQSGAPGPDLRQLQPLTSLEQVLQVRQLVRQVESTPAILDYLLALVRKTRHLPDLALGASPRAAVLWLRAAQAHAWLSSRSFLTPDDVKAVAQPLLCHRLVLRPEAQLDGVKAEHLITTLLQQVAVPR